MENAVIQLHYRRVHLPSGNVYIGRFNASHLPMFEHLGVRRLEQELRQIVDQWNKEFLDTWQYAYIGVRNQEVADWESQQALRRAS